MEKYGWLWQEGSEDLTEEGVIKVTFVTLEKYYTESCWLFVNGETDKKKKREGGDISQKQAI